MDLVRSWKMISITLFCLVHCLHYNFATAAAAAAIDEVNESESHMHDSFEPHEIWSPLLEELTIK